MLGRIYGDLLVRKNVGCATFLRSTDTIIRELDIAADTSLKIYVLLHGVLAPPHLHLNGP